MSAIPVNIVIDKNANFDATFYLSNKDGTPLNLTGYTGVSALKKSYAATTSIPFTLTFLNRTLGEIKISLTASQTGALDRRRYVYDILITSPNNYKTRVIEGIVEVTPGVS